MFYLNLFCYVLNTLKGKGKELKDCLEKVCEVIVQTDWKVLENKNNLNGIEHPALHMVLKKLAQHDKVNIEKNEITFGGVLLEYLNEEVVSC